MPITRTTMIDDDGTGTTGTILNNAWLQTIYGQIDALAGRVAWTPSDGSGAGLTLNVYSAGYAIMGKLVAVAFHIGYPATSSSAMALIAGLPFPPAINSGLYTSYGIHRHLMIPAGIGGAQVFSPSTGAQLTNADLSGAGMMASGVYLIA